MVLKENILILICTLISYKFGHCKSVLSLISLSSLTKLRFWILQGTPLLEEQASWTTWNIKGIQAVLGTQSRNISWCHKICFVVWVGQGHLGRIFSVIRI